MVVVFAHHATLTTLEASTLRIGSARALSGSDTFESIHGLSELRHSLSLFEQLKSNFPPLSP